MVKRKTLNPVAFPTRPTTPGPSDSPYQPLNDTLPEPVIPTAKVSGRTRAVFLLEELLSRSGNLVTLDAALQKEFEDNPTKFFRIYVMPFIPKQTKLDVKGLPVEIRIVNINSMDGGLPHGP